VADFIKGDIWDVFLFFIIGGIGDIGRQIVETKFFKISPQLEGLEIGFLSNGNG